MKKASFYAIIALLSVLVLAACGSTKEPISEQDGTPVQVTNRNWLSMEVYVTGQSQRVRLGRVGSGQTKRFMIPNHLLTGATPLRFILESSGPQRDVLSESFVVTPGEEVVLVIPNTR